MTVDRYLRMVAGTFVLLSLALGYWVSPSAARSPWSATGTVVDLMHHWRESGVPVPALVHVIGTIPMMSAAARLTREWGVRTYASLNPIMVDGPGMCGGCRVSVGGKRGSLVSRGPSSYEVDFQEVL